MKINFFFFGAQMFSCGQIALEEYFEINLTGEASVIQTTPTEREIKGSS